MQFAYLLFIYLDFCVSSLFLHWCSIFSAFSLLFFNLLCLRSPFPKVQGWILSSFCLCPPKLGPGMLQFMGFKGSDTTERLNRLTEAWSSGLCKLCIRWDLCWVSFCLFVCLFVLSLMVKAEQGHNPVCWWLGLNFCFVYCLHEASCTGCYWWLGDAGSCIQVVSFVWVLIVLYSPELVLW